MAQRSFTTHPVVLRRLTVARVVDVTPRMRRITLAGDQLAAFRARGLELPAFASTGFDDHVKLVFAADGDVAGALPVQLAHTIDWPDAPHRRTRDYTVRRFDPLAGEVDLDFVRHGEGPAAGWAEQAAVGDELHLAGPKSSLVLPAGVDWALLAGDETALPAIGRFLDERPLDVPLQLVVELEHPDGRQDDLPLRPGDTVRWVEAGGLADGVRGIEWWPGRVLAWAAAESGALLPLRRWLTRDRAVPKSHQNVTGYWHADPAPVDPSAGPPAVDAETLLSPVPWFAARAAAELGLLDALAHGAREPVELAGALGLPEGPTRTLVDYLVSIEVLVTDPSGGVGLGPVGEQLLGDEHLLEGIEDTPEARAVAALAELAPALRSGEAAYLRQHGRSLLQEVESDPAAFGARLEEVTSFAFVARGLLDLPAVRAAEKIAVTGAGSVVLAETLAGRSAVTVVEAPVPLAALRAAAEDLPVAFADELPAADLAVCGLALAYRSDAEAVALLQRLAVATDRAVVIEALDGPGLRSPHAAEHRLVDLAATGLAVRSADDVARLASAAGWAVTGSTTLGWNHEAFELSR
jgi:NADPH-dependent ferric siderophore reductase